MSGPGSRWGEGILTPAVAAAVVFVVLAGGVAMAFVGARGGLELPVAATGSPGIALASTSPTLAPTTPAPATSAPATLPPSVAPSLVTSPEPSAPGPTASPAATVLPSLGPTPGPSSPADPLTALPACPDHPGCYEYTVRIGDSFTAVNDRFGLLLWITDALNPEVADKGVIVVGQTLYLGRDPEARLDPCPDGAPCRLYVTRSGDTLSRIAARFGITVTGIEALNPALDPNAFGPGTLVRLPRYLG
ncbi:MAG TPA: LysM peptidoglycan-binding domain-containing protein [Candidatus Limnocylindrales bacterium]